MTEKQWILYVHTTPNGKKYIGITSMNPTRRWRSNGSGYKTSSYFYNAILKYGWDNIQHEILYTHLTLDEANELEMKLIKEFKTNDKEFGYNSTLGGDGVKGFACSEEKKAKLSELMKGEGNHMYGVSLKGMSGVDNPMYGKPSGGIKKVMCITTNEIFDYVTLASEKYGTHRSDINKVCTGRRSYAGLLDGQPLVWRYVE